MADNNSNDNNTRPSQRRRAPNGSYLEVSTPHVTESNRERAIERNRERSEALSRLFATRLAINNTYATDPNNQEGGRRSYRRRSIRHKRKSHRKRGTHQRRSHRRKTHRRK